MRTRLRKKQWNLMGKMREDFQSGNDCQGGKLDEQTASKAFEATGALRRQMFENRIAAQKRIDDVPTPRQRERMQHALSRP